MTIVEAERLLAGSPGASGRRRRGVVAPVGEIAGRGRGPGAAGRHQPDQQALPVGGGGSAFDCSGLTYWAFRQVGVTLPRSSGQQALVGRPVGRPAAG